MKYSIFFALTLTSISFSSFCSSNKDEKGKDTSTSSMNQKVNVTTEETEKQLLIDQVYKILKQSNKDGKTADPKQLKALQKMSKERLTIFIQGSQRAQAACQNALESLHQIKHANANSCSSSSSSSSNSTDSKNNK